MGNVVDMTQTAALVVGGLTLYTLVSGASVAGPGFRYQQLKQRQLAEASASAGMPSDEHQMVA